MKGLNRETDSFQSCDGEPGKFGDESSSPPRPIFSHCIHSVSPRANLKVPADLLAPPSIKLPQGKSVENAHPGSIDMQWKACDAPQDRTDDGMVHYAHGNFSGGNTSSSEKGEGVKYEYAQPGFYPNQDRKEEIANDVRRSVAFAALIRSDEVSRSDIFVFRGSSSALRSKLVLD